MQRKLRKTLTETYFYKNGMKIIGIHDFLRGDVNGLSGDVSGLRGDVSGLSGNVSGIRGDVSGIRGNIDLCKINLEERGSGIKIEDLIVEEEIK